MILTPIVTYFLSPDVSEMMPNIIVESNQNSIYPVKINNNADLERISETMTWPYKSVSEDAYVFDGVSIDGSSHGYCIYIGNTTETIIIRNCTFQNTLDDITLFVDNAAIIIYNARNIKIDNNSIFNNQNGIYLEKSYVNTITNNSIFNNTNGIMETEGGFNWIENNNFESNLESGIDIDYSESDTIRNNTFFDNKYGMNTYSSSPAITKSTFQSNLYGIYARFSGIIVEECIFNNNSYGTYYLGDSMGNEVNLFDFSQEEEIFTSVSDFNEFRTNIAIPSNAIINSASMNLQAKEINDEVLNVDSTMQMSPVIYNDIIVWQDYVDSNWEIFAYNLSMDSDGNGVPNYLEFSPPEHDLALHRITKNPDMQMCPAFDGNTIVWTGISNSNYNIYAYSFSNKTEWPVCTENSVQRNPAVYGDKIVWEDFRDGNYNIFLLNVTRGEVSRLSTSSRHDMAPEIHENYVVWHSYCGSPGSCEYSDIVMFDLKAWTLNDITTDVPLQYNPDIYDNNIVWHDQRNGNWEIYIYDISTKTEKRLTYEKQHSFCPKIDKNKVVYYYHDRYTDYWSARLYDLDTEEQTIIGERTFGDSHPDVYGERIVWISRENGGPKIRVMDNSIMGLPSNVKIDLGADGSYELEISGDMVNELCFNGSKLIEAIQKEIASSSFMGIIPIMLSFNNTGRIVFSNLSITYELPTIIESSYFNGSIKSAICVYASSPLVANTSLTENNVDIIIISNSIPVFRNTSYSRSHVCFYDAAGKLMLQNFLYIKVTNISGAPINATACISTDQKIIFNNSIGREGIAGGLIMDVALYFRKGRIKNETEIFVSYEGHYFDNNNRIVNMTKSHWEYFITDTVAPQVSRPFPAPGQYHNNLNPIVSIHITDNNLINLSSVSLFVQNYAVFYQYEATASGYNISYRHSIAYENGELIRCRLFGKDFHNNEYDYSWEFKINIQTIRFTKELDIGWNLVSIPLTLYNTSVENVLSSIAGSYDKIMSYDSQDIMDPWKRYVSGQSGSRTEFNEINSIKGYWIDVTEPCTLSITGICEPQIIPLYSGWNLVGYPSLCTETTVSNAFWGTGADRVEIFDPSSPYLIRVAEPDQLMMPGDGYWVHVAVDSVWVVDDYLE